MNDSEKAQREAVGKRLRQARLNAKLSQDDLAQALGVTQAMAGRYERGLAPLDRLGIEAWARRTRTDPSWLLYGQEGFEELRALHLARKLWGHPDDGGLSEDEVSAQVQEDLEKFGSYAAVIEEYERISNTPGIPQSEVVASIALTQVFQTLVDCLRLNVRIPDEPLYHLLLLEKGEIPHLIPSDMDFVYALLVSDPNVSQSSLVLHLHSLIEIRKNARNTHE